MWYCAWTLCGTVHGSYVVLCMDPMWYCAWILCGTVHGPYVVLCMDPELIIVNYKDMAATLYF